MLNTVTYQDMVVRARPASSTPHDTVDALSRTTHLPIPGRGQEPGEPDRWARPLTGIAAGVGTGMLMALARAVGCRPGRVVSGLTAALGAPVAPTGS